MESPKKFDRRAALRTIKSICRTSKYIDVGFNPHEMSHEVLAEYLASSRKRLDVFARRMQRLGYTTDLTNFEHGGQQAVNCLAYSGKEVQPGSLLLVAHHDYCAGVGAEDNATALATMIELARIFAGEPGLCFGSFDLEEHLCQGSSAFLKSLSDEQFAKFAAVIDLECLGSGKDIIICERVSGAVSDPQLIDAVQSAANRAGHQLPVRGYDYFYADHVPFAKRGAKTVEIGSADASSSMSKADLAAEWQRILRGEHRSDGSVAHTAFDTPEYIKGKNLQIVGDTLVELFRAFGQNGKLFAPGKTHVR